MAIKKAAKKTSPKKKAAKKKTAKKKATKKKAKATPRARKSASGKRSSSAVRVRMYRQGLGDCFLITLPRKNGQPYYIMIDCGVILGTSDAAAKMKDVVSDIIATTHGHIDLLIATHEHWDHLSGFVQAQDLFSGLKVDKVWVAWTEDPSDALANELRAHHNALRMALASASARMRIGAGGNSTVDGLLEFFGAAGQGTTGDALKFLKGLPKDGVRFCLPKDEPVELEGIDARFFILGPPHDAKMIKRYNPSKAHSETYSLAALAMLEATRAGGDAEAPFDPIIQIPLDAARQMPFFQTRYWGEDADSDEKDQSWRRIDGDWLDTSSALALQLDSATNNTSLVLAIELGNGEVLLFVADAQVGNWLSWQDLSWTVDGKTISGPDLLERTILYKTGHHGSHNATLQEKGLEMMKNLRIALIPVDRQMALKKHWNMPLDSIEKTLNAMTNGCVLRIDKDVPPALAGSVEQDAAKKLYYEVIV